MLFKSRTGKIILALSSTILSISAQADKPNGPQGGADTVCAKAEATVAAIVFKEPNANNGALSNGRQFMVICENGKLISGGLVSTGLPAAKDKKEWKTKGDISVETDTGTYQVLSINNFRNDAFPNFHPSNSAVYKSKDVDGHGDLNGHYDQAIHDSMPVSGEPASHGCVRTNEAGAFVSALNRNGGAGSGKVQIYGANQPNLTDADKSKLGQVR